MVGCDCGSCPDVLAADQWHLLQRFEVPAILTSLRIEKNDEMIIEGPRFPFKKSIRRYVQAGMPSHVRISLTYLVALSDWRFDSFAQPFALICYLHADSLWPYVAAEERFNALLRSYEARLDIRLVLPGKMGV